MPQIMPTFASYRRVSSPWSGHLFAVARLVIDRRRSGHQFAHQRTTLTSPVRFSGTRRRRASWGWGLCAPAEICSNTPKSRNSQAVALAEFGT